MRTRTIAAVRVALLILGTATVAIPQALITTFAGTDFVYPGQPLPALNAPLGAISAVTLDTQGNLYIADTDDKLVLKLDQQGILTIVAGNGVKGFSGDGGNATSASLAGPSGVAVDATGNLFIADGGNRRIRKVTPDGIITTVAGNGTEGHSGDGDPATTASLYGPSGVAVDATGNLFIADFNRIRKVTPSGIITTVAGNGDFGFFGDGGMATNASLYGPSGVAVDAAGNLFIADQGNNRIRKVTPGGIISTVAGGGQSRFSGDGGSATSAALYEAGGVAVDAEGNLFIADQGNNRIRKVTPGGIITTVAGNGRSGFFGDGGSATSAPLGFPSGLAVDAAANLFIADTFNNRIRSITPAGIITTVAGNGAYHFAGEGTAASSAVLFGPVGLALDAAGSLFIADQRNNRIRKVTPDGVIVTVAGDGFQDFSGDEGPATSASLNNPAGVAIDAAGSLFIADQDNNRIRKVTPDGIISTVAGNGSIGSFSGDGGAATSASLNLPYGVAVDAAGILFISDRGNRRVRKVTSDGIITTVAGGGLNSPADGGSATTALLNLPSGVTVDAAGNLFFAEGNARIRKVSPEGIITTVAGGGFNPVGDGGPATNALLRTPTGIAINAAGALFFADADDQRIRKVTPDGLIITVAGNGAYSFSGDGGPATSASLWQPSGVAVDAAGNLFIADSGNNRIRVVSSYAGPALPQAYPPSSSPTILGGFASTRLGGLYQITATVPFALPARPVPVVVGSAAQSSQPGPLGSGLRAPRQR